MFLVNRLFGINSTSPTPELITIDNGRLFLVRPESIKGSRECIFIDASISIRRTTHEFNYQLVVTRTFQEGEELLLEEDTENSDERSFLLDSSLFLSLGPSLDPSNAPALSFTWLDPEGDSPEDEFEFVLTENTGREEVEDFERLSWRCMWERRERTGWPTDSAEVARIEGELEEDFKVERAPLTTRNQPTSTTSKQPLFRAPSPTPSLSSEDDFDEEEVTQHHIATPTTLPRGKVNNKNSDSEDELSAALLSKAVISDTTPSAAGKTKSSSSSPAVALSTPSKSKGKGKAPRTSFTRSPSPPPLTSLSTSRPPKTNPAPQSTDALVTVSGELHLFDRSTSLFMMQEEEITCSLHRVEGEEVAFWLLVEGGKGVWVSQGVEKDMVINFSEKELAMVFNFKYDTSSAEAGSQTYTWLVRFTEQVNFDKMQEGISTALFEGKWGRGSWKKLKEDERDWQKNAYIEDSEMYNIPEEVPEEDYVEEEEEEEESDVENDSDDGDEREGFAPKGNKAKNSQLAVGYKEDLSFVVQGDMIGVFKQQRDGGKKLKFVTSIVNIATPDGKKGFTPSKVMLHNQDTSMILQNPLAPGALYRLDLETGKVVDEYKVSDNFSISNFIPDSKFAQTTQQQTFIGLSHNGVFRVDPRLNGIKLVESEFKQYATKNDFSAAVTTESGKIAIASNKGDIRLFDKLGKIAKTLLPALGDAMIGIDTSADGRWVLATCKTYLLLFDTQIPEGAGKYGGSSGFDRSFPADQKPTPRRLQLKPEHVAHMQEQSREGVSFTPAKFNAGIGETERTIVTSTGPFIVAWNLRHVKAGNVTSYTLRRFSDTVIADAFKFGGDREIVVTLPGNVFVEDKKKLKAPTRDSMSRIVQTWD